MSVYVGDKPGNNHGLNNRARARADPKPNLGIVKRAYFAFEVEEGKFGLANVDVNRLCGGAAAAYNLVSLMAAGRTDGRGTRWAAASRNFARSPPPRNLAKLEIGIGRKWRVSETVQVKTL